MKVKKEDMKEEEKKGDEEKTEKAMDAQMQTILQNIQALIQELQTAGGADTENPEEPKEKEVKMTIVDKDIVSTLSDDVTGSDDAKEKIDQNVSDETDKAEDQVAKAIISALKNINKSQEPIKKDPVVKAIEDLTKSIIEIAKNVNGNSQAITNILEGIGVTKQLEIVEKSKAKPVVGNSTEQQAEFLQALTKALQGKTKEETVWNTPAHEVNKNLNDANVLKALITGGKK